jgi:hypothetical protein
MQPSPTPQDELDGFWDALDALQRGVARTKAVNVNAEGPRQSARALAQRWFRAARPFVLQVGVPEEQIRAIDQDVQYLLQLAMGRNAKTSYASTIRRLRRVRPTLAAGVELLRGAREHSSPEVVVTHVEASILATLDQLIPSAGFSYRQVLADLSGPLRHSYRGTATELREVVREVLDHLAPDAEVMNAPGFKLEKDRTKPTMKQKARFILKARGAGDSSRRAPEDAAELLEDQVAGLARSVYDRGSASTHSATTREHVSSFKAYADATLAELLQVHR